MVAALVRLREALQSATLPLDVPVGGAGRAVRDEMVDQLEDYVLPRLIQIDAPLLTVVGGSTGAGKSTLVNSLVGNRVTEPGVLRPTTRSPGPGAQPRRRRLVRQAADPARAGPHHRRDRRPGRAAAGRRRLGARPGWRSSTPPTSTRSRSTTGCSPPSCSPPPTCGCSSPRPPATPTRCRGSSSRRPPTAAPRSRSCSTAPPRPRSTRSASHLARMLTARGLRDSPLFTVAEATVDDDGLLPAEAVARHPRVARACSPPTRTPARPSYARRWTGAVRSVAHAHLRRRRRPGRPGRRWRHRLREDADRAYDEALAKVDEASADGTLLRGEVLARWQEFVGTGELLRSLESKVGWLRDRVVNVGQGQAAAGRAGHRRGRVRPGVADPASRPRPPPSGPTPPGARWPPASTSPRTPG